MDGKAEFCIATNAMQNSSMFCYPCSANRCGSQGSKRVLSNRLGPYQFSIKKIGSRGELAARSTCTPGNTFRIQSFAPLDSWIERAGGYARALPLTRSGAPPLRTLLKGLSPLRIPFCCRAFGAVMLFFLLAIYPYSYRTIVYQLYLHIGTKRSGLYFFAKHLL